MADEEMQTPAVRAAVLKVLIDQLQAAYKLVRADADDELRSMYEKNGGSRQDVVVPGLGKIAKLSLSVPDEAIGINDESLLWWVKQRYPAAVLKRTIVEEFVSAEFVKDLVKRLRYDAEEDAIVDSETSEVVPWARIVPKGRGTVSLTFERGARRGIEALWKDGLLQPQLMLEAKPLDPDRGGSDVVDAEVVDDGS